MNRKTRSHPYLFITRISASVLFMFYLCVSPMASASSPAECEYGTFDAWFSVDGETWSNSTVEDVVLLRGQPFFIRTMMSTKKDSVRVGLLFIEPGEDTAAGATYEIIDDTLSMFEPYLYGSIGTSFIPYEHTWCFQVKNDTDWFQASAPLNVFVQFDALINEVWVSDEISFTLVCPFILEDVYDDADMNDTLFDSTNDAPEGAMSFVSIIVILFLLRRRL